MRTSRAHVPCMPSAPRNCVQVAIAIRSVQLCLQLYVPRGLKSHLDVPLAAAWQTLVLLRCACRLPRNAVGT